MRTIVRHLVFLAFAGWLLYFCGCSGNSPLDPASPSTTPDNPVSLTQEANPSPNTHYLWGYYMVRIDPTDLSFQFVPIREVTAHWNVLKFLEKAPCTNCVKILSMTNSDHGTKLVDIQIKHPFPMSNFTGFDVRGVAMFRGSKMFPAMGLNVPDGSLGDGELVNADGFTSLYHFGTESQDPTGWQSYFKGKFATLQAPNAILNGYKRFIAPNPSNTRNAFYAGTSITATYDIDMPVSQFILGYAVDASWAPPTTKPVTNPMTDFGPDANCPEAWKMVVTDTPVGNGLTDCGGQVSVAVDVYDWQGKDDAHPLMVECPELFDGQVEAAWKADGAGFTTYEAVVENAKNAPVGLYRCLVSKEAQENDPSKSWLDISAYQLHELEVVAEIKQAPTAIAEVSQTSAFVDEPISFDASKSHDNDCGNQSVVTCEWDWDNDGIYDQQGVKVDHSWSTDGLYKVQLRVTDDDSQTDTLDQPLEITINKTLPPIAMATVDSPVQDTGQPVHFSDDGSYDPDGGSIVKYEWDWDNDGTFDQEGIEADHSWPTAGTYYVQFRVTDDEGQTGILDAPLEITVVEVGPPFNPVDVTPLSLNFSPIDVCVDGTYAYVAGDFNGLHIFDISDPANPVWVNMVETPGRATDVVVSGGYAYVADWDSGLQIIDIDPPESAYLVKSLDLPSDAYGVAVSGGYAYIADFTSGLQIIDIDPPESASIVSSVNLDTAYKVLVSDGYAYVADIESGLQIIDIDPPESAYIVSTVDTPTGAVGVAVSNGYAFVADYDSLQIIDIDPPESANIVNSVVMPEYTYGVEISGGYAYLTNWNSGLYIIDIEPLDSAYIVNSVDTPGLAYGLAVSGGYAYIADGPAGLQTIDIDPPEAASTVNSIDTIGDAWGVAVSGSYAYVADSGSGLSIVHIDPPESPSIVKSLQLPFSAYAVAIAEDYAYVADNTAGLQIIDIDPPESASIMNSVDTPGHAHGIAVSGGYAYVADEAAGLQIIDIDPPESAYIVTSVNTPGSAYGVAVSGGYAYVADTGKGLQIIDIDPPESAYIVNSVYTGYAQGVAVSGSYAYVADGGDGLQIVDIDPPESASIFGSVDTPGYAYGVAVSGGDAYVADMESGLQILDIDPPAYAHIENSADTPGNAIGVAVSGNYAYIADEGNGLRIIKLW